MKKEMATSLILAVAALMLLAARPTDYAWFTNIERDADGNAIYFESCDSTYGPIRSNDTFHFRNSTIFGPVMSAQDTFVAEGDNHFEYDPELGVDSLFGFDGLCQDIQENANFYVTSRGFGGRRYMTWIRLRGDAGLQIFQYPLGGVRAESLIWNLAVPNNIRIWVDGPVEVQGLLTGQLIIGSSDDITLIDDVRYTRASQFRGDFNEEDPSVGMLALVSEKDIIIDDNYRNGKRNGANVGGQDWNRHSIVITAAIVCPDGSFTFEHQNYDWEMYQGPTPDYRGTVYLKGCVIQNRRGRLHNDNHEFTGYGLALRYDFRFLERSPIPYEPERHRGIYGNYEELRLDTYHSYLVGDAVIRRLTIPAGANIMFVDGSRLEILESLEIAGNEDTTVVVHASVENIDARLVVNGIRNSRVEISHARFEQGISVEINADTVVVENSEFASVVELSGGLNVSTSMFHDPVKIRQTEGGKISRSVVLGGMEIDRSCTHLQVINNTFVGSRYDGITVEGGEDIQLTNNIIAGNRRGIYLQSLEYPTLSYNLLWDNGNRDYIGLEPGANDLTADPVLVNQRRGNYYLQAGSPCIDAGDPDSPRDPDGTRADIGAFWFDQGLEVDTSAVSPPRLTAAELKGGVLSASPNPFNATTVIRFKDGYGDPSSLRIFDLVGRKVYSSVNRGGLTEKLSSATPLRVAERKTADHKGSAEESSFTWNAAGFPAGIYIVRLDAGGRINSLKLVLLK